jgi:hypothetical protein
MGFRTLPSRRVPMLSKRELCGNQSDVYVLCVISSCHQSDHNVQYMSLCQIESIGNKSLLINGF